jgi:hypothetical protein
VVPLRRTDEETVTTGTRVGHLLRITNYLEIAVMSMWTGSPRTSVMLGMVEASVRGEGLGGKDEDLLEKLRALIGEAKEYYAGGDFPAAMARMSVAHDLVDLRIIALTAE